MRNIIQVRLLALLAAAALAGVAAPAQAAPVARPAVLTMTVTLTGLSSITLTGAGLVSVDSTAGTISVAAGLVALGGPVVIPVTSTTAINSITASVISNQAGVLSVGGGAGLSFEPSCATALPGQVGCVSGAGFGGLMGVSGVVNVAVIPNIVVIPVNLNDARLGQGGTATTPFLIDAAPWTRNAGAVGLTTGTIPVSGTTFTAIGPGPDTVVLVSPTFVNALGNALPLITSFAITFTDGGGLPGFVNAMAPEPGTLLLLGSGIAGLVVVGRRKR